MNKRFCIRCGSELSGPFCIKCGQKAENWNDELGNDNKYTVKRSKFIYAGIIVTVVIMIISAVMMKYGWDRMIGLMKSGYTVSTGLGFHAAPDIHFSKFHRNILLLLEEAIFVFIIITAWKNDNNSMKKLVAAAIILVFMAVGVFIAYKLGSQLAAKRMLDEYLSQRFGIFSATALIVGMGAFVFQCEVAFIMWIIDFIILGIGLKREKQ